MKYNLILVYFFFSTLLFAAKKERIFISDSSKPPSEKEAILILPGFGSKIHGTKQIAEFFFNKGYDVFIPDYIARNSIADCVDNLDKFIAKYKLLGYKNVKVFSYIVGSWTINTWINKHPENNIITIVYDRSPLQERAPFALIKDMPHIIRLVSGKIMREFSVTAYPPLYDKKINKGIMIESTATKLIIKHKKSALSLGPVRWDAASLNQTNNDAIYTWLNHDDMYSRFDVIGNEILYFMANNKFTDGAKREPYTDDPFIKHKN